MSDGLPVVVSDKSPADGEHRWKDFYAPDKITVSAAEVARLSGRSVESIMDRLVGESVNTGVTSFKRVS